MSKDLIVETTLGKIRGYSNRGVVKFKGIPYAAPPIDNLRFKPPQPFEPWTGIREAIKYSPVAPQPISNLEDMFGERPIQNEAECLTLNIWTQSLDDKKRPVMFFIHGGSFRTGSGGSLDGARLVLRGDIVVVSINYRLGALGFLYIPDNPDVTANMGLLDMIAALRWVRDNISQFGGDQDNITIFGESAGSAAISCLLGMPSAKDLFHRAILQSGAARKNRYKPSSGIKVYEDIIQKLGLQKGDINSLRKIPPEDLINAQISSSIFQIGVDNLGPIIDGETLPEHPLEAIKKGFSRDIEIFIGTNLDESKLWTMFPGENGEITENELFKYVNSIMKSFKKSDKKSNEMVEVYKKSKKTYKNIRDAISTDYSFRIPSIRLAEEQSQHQKHTYMYLFCWKSPLQGGKYGAMHILELPFVFGLMGDEAIGVYPRKTEETQQLSEKMMDAWISFAHTGNPNHNTIPEIPPYDKENRYTILFDKEITIEIDPYESERIAWDGIF
ncbi:MAG: carboxylesterase/lipase family protein [Promethearchaeota archaeon]|jgi:para-nitrobenzyl esterase